MGNKINKYLIIISFVIISCLSSAIPAYASQEAGQSASIAAAIHSDDSQQQANINLKRKVLHKVFEDAHSPFVDEVDAFINTCTKYNLDCYLLPSISGLESSFGRFTWPDSHNPFGWGGGYIMFDSWADCIDTVGKTVRGTYIEKWHADTIEKMGPIYAESPTWAERVRMIHNRFEAVEKEQALYFQNIAVE